MKKYKIGYTQGTFDMFHIGHLNLLHQARELCEELIVGVNTDHLVNEYKHKQPVSSVWHTTMPVTTTISIGNTLQVKAMPTSCSSHASTLNPQL